MAYSLTWDKNRSLLNFYKSTDIKEINEANWKILLDDRLKNNHQSIWNFLQADLSTIALTEANFLANIDRSASNIVPFVKVAFVAHEKHTLDICKQYVEYSKKFESKWEMRIFDSMGSAIKWCYS